MDRVTQRPLVMARPSAPLIIGEAPARDTEYLPAFCGRSGARLSSLLGADVLSVARTMNLLPEWPGPSGVSGAAFPMEAARARAGRIASFRPLAACACGSRKKVAACGTCGRLGSDIVPTVLLAGRRVATAFGVGRQPYFSWFRLLDAVAAVIPHPSGASRFWNVPSNVDIARAFLRAVFKER